MTIGEFRAHDYLASEWAKLLHNSPILQRVLQVMEENHPARYALLGDNNADVSPTRASIELGVTRGYSRYGDTLRLLAEPIKKMADIGEPTYEQEENKEAQT